MVFRVLVVVMINVGQAHSQVMGGRPGCLTHEVGAGMLRWRMQAVCGGVATLGHHHSCRICCPGNNPVSSAQSALGWDDFVPVKNTQGGRTCKRECIEEVG